MLEAGAHRFDLGLHIQKRLNSLLQSTEKVNTNLTQHFSDYSSITQKEILVSIIFLLVIFIESICHNIDNYTLHIYIILLHNIIECKMKTTNCFIYTENVYRFNTCPHNKCNSIYFNLLEHQ